MKTYAEWTRSGSKVITITCKDNNNTLEKILNSIKSVGNMGHTFSIVIDPDSNEGEKFEWDGDGSDSIQEIKISTNA